MTRSSAAPASSPACVAGNPADLVDSYRVLDYEFLLRTRLPHVAALVEELLFPFKSQPVRDAPVYEVVDNHQPWSPFAAYFRGQSIREHDSLEPVLDYLLWHINREAIDSVTGRVVLHASAASFEGQGILMPAPQDSGKSTLVAGLTAAGLSYLTDEAAPLDLATHLLHPYPKPIWLEGGSVDALQHLIETLPPAWGRRLGKRRHVRPEQLSANTTWRPCPIRYVIAPRYEAGSHTRLQPMSKGQALVSLAESSFNFRRFGGAGLALLSDVVGGAHCYQLRMGDLASAVRAVLELVDDSGRLYLGR